MVAPPTTAALPFAAYVLLALGVGGGVPFVRFPAFSFPLVQPPAAVPIFVADGILSEPTDFVDFAALPGAQVDVDHPGYTSPVAHRFVETRRWLDDHQGAGGPVTVAVGLRVFHFSEGGDIVTTDRIDATGSARRGR